MMVQVEFSVLEEIQARQALHDINTRYCRGADRADAALFGSVWADGAQVDCGPFVGPAADFVRIVTAPDEVRVRSSHTISNEYFEIDGEQGRGESCVTAVSTLNIDGKQVDQLIGGRYLDQYKKVGGEWKIARRTFVLDWNMNMPATADAGLFAQFKQCGSRGKADPFFALFTQS